MTRPTKRGVRTISSTSYIHASLTLEATLVFPFFIMALLSVMSFISILGLQTSLQIRLEETARQLNTISYISMDISDTDISSEFLTIAGIRQFFLSEEIRELCDHNYIKNGYQGIQFNHTKINAQSDIVDLSITYTIELPFIPRDLVTFHFTQNTSFKLFTGIQNFNADKNNFSTVYITPNGTVYHTQKYCTYLRKYTDIILESSLRNYESKTGKNLSPCSYCRKYYDTESDSTIYISKSGDSYHYTSECYHLNLIIYAFNQEDISEIYTPCQRCASN